MKTFNTTGPIKQEKNYYISHRLNEREIRFLIDQEKYFVLHAPRQSGKTTAIVAFVKELNQEGRYKALYINIESAQAARSDFIKGLTIILNNFKLAILDNFGAKDSGLVFLEKILETKNINGASFGEFLQFWSQNSDKPILLFIDEIDSLVGDTLISVLRQLCAGYINRPKSFPQAVCFVGVRDVRDYRIWSDSDQATVLGGSAFNIKAESLTLADFSKEQLTDLYNQHTQETGQKFTQEALDYAFYLTQGQPWLTNALAYQACFKDKTEHTTTITKDILETAKEALIKRQDTHLDVLYSRLNEPRVRNVIDAVINSDTTMQLSEDNDDVKYVIDLGLIKIDQHNLWIANPMYKEVLPRALSSAMQLKLSSRSVDYKNPDGTLNMHKLLEKFVQFYRENSADWLKDVHYKESGPHLLLMAFLQRIINGGGTIHREYALGRGRVDLSIHYGTQRILVEIKVKRSERTLDEGLEQTANYMDQVGDTEGHLVIFNPHKDISWDEKVFTRVERFNDKVITVWGL